MADPFTKQFQHGLSDLPVAPPDDVGGGYPPAGFTLPTPQPFGGPQIVTAGIPWNRLRQNPIGALGQNPPPPPQIPMPDAWKTWGPALGLTLQMLPSLIPGVDRGGRDGDNLQIFPRVTPRSGRGQESVFRRCMAAAAGDNEDWENFCRSIGGERNNVSAGEMARQACWSKTETSRNVKENWCKNQYGPDAAAVE